jgi:hypothetical protein
MKHSELLCLLFLLMKPRCVLRSSQIDVSPEDLKKLFESVGEVVDVSTAYFLWFSFCICFILQFIVTFLCRCECEETGKQAVCIC